MQNLPPELLTTIPKGAQLPRTPPEVTNMLRAMFPTDAEEILAQKPSAGTSVAPERSDQSISITQK